MTKRNVAIVTGGDSLEAASSFASADNIYDCLDPARFNRFLLSVENWQWRVIKADTKSADWCNAASVDLSGFTLLHEDKRIEFDGVFIAVHGAPGETGHLSAYFELVGLPYTGSGVLASALAMDKSACKQFVSSACEVRMPRGFVVGPSEIAHTGDLPEGFAYPLIIKPNAYGSGIEVTLVDTPAALEKSLTRIRKLGHKVVVEEHVSGREFTVGAVVLNGAIEILPIAEVFRPDQSTVLAKNGEAAFTDRQSAQIVIAPDLEEKIAVRLRDVTASIGETLGCRSFYRADFIVTDCGEVCFLELNTIPGTTPRSVFTAQIRHSRFTEKELYNRIMAEAMGQTC